MFFNTNLDMNNYNFIFKDSEKQNKLYIYSLQQKRKEENSLKKMSLICKYVHTSLICYTIFIVRPSEGLGIKEKHTFFQLGEQGQDPRYIYLMSICSGYLKKM